MEEWPFHDGNVHKLLDNRHIDIGRDVGRSLQMHSSLIRKLSLEQELKGHEGCVNAVAWNSNGSLLISGSDDARINIWSYSGRKLLHSIETGHSGKIFCTKFIPETSGERVVSGAGDAEVRLFNLSRVNGRGLNDGAITPSALYQCHTKRVKKLAVEVGNPNMVWSASEDGTLRQYDFREGTSCPPAFHQECRNVLLDLRSGAKRTLADPPRHKLALKSCDISSTRPHLLLVGGNDSFARLYDRRMLPPLTSGCNRMLPPTCINYFCPMHLSDHGRASLHLTHVMFSPNGEEVLLSYSGEHVYLMDINHDNGSLMQYTSGDASKSMTFTPVLDKQEHQTPISSVFQNGRRCRSNSVARLQMEKCRILTQAKKSFDEGTNTFHAIEACNEVLDGHDSDIGPTLRLECFCTRAALLLKRKWKNDAHMAIRDCHNARRIDSSSFRAHYCMVEALEQLGKHKEALDFAVAAQCLSPDDTMAAEKVENIRKHLAAAESGKNNKSEPRTGRAMSPSHILSRSEGSSDALEDGPRTEREDSDFDFGTRETGLYGSCGHPSSSQNGVAYQPEAVIDMKRRYVGHCNFGTDIKQASFLGQRGEFVASGSDDGRWFIWEKQTGRLIKMLHGDDNVVNCVQCHPFDCFVATSGIDNTIKLWSPTAAAFPSMVAGGSAGPEAENVLEAMESNQRNLRLNWPDELFGPYTVNDIFGGSLQTFEPCAQS